MHRVTRKYLLTSAANGSGAVAPGGVLLLLDPLPQLVPPRRQVPAGVQEALEGRPGSGVAEVVLRQLDPLLLQDRKSTRLNSSHVAISYAVFCLTKKYNRVGAGHSER